VGSDGVGTSARTGTITWAGAIVSPDTVTGGIAGAFANVGTGAGDSTGTSSGTAHTDADHRWSAHHHLVAGF